MPIIQTPSAEAPLTQGDILSGVALFATKGSWEDEGGQAAVTKFDLCLVLSRPCVAAYKKHIVVAGVAKYPDAVPKGIDSFDKWSTSSPGPAMAATPLTSSTWVNSPDG